MSRINPGLPEAVVRASADLVADTGELRHTINWTVTPETISEFRQGYRCALPPHGCGAAQPEPFPSKCVEPYCNFNLKRDLIPWLEQHFAGEEDLWPEETRPVPFEQRMEQHRFYANKAGIVLPPGFRP